jgi:hypothetical protein
METKSKSNAHTIGCMYCDKNIRQDRMGLHYLSKHRDKLLRDPHFQAAVNSSVKHERETVILDGRHVCLCCGSGFSVSDRKGFDYNDIKLRAERDQAIDRHFIKYSDHAKINLTIHANLKKEIDIIKAEPESPQPLHVSDPEELKKLKKEMEALKIENEKLKKQQENLQASKNAFLDTFEKIPNFINKLLNCNNGEGHKVYDYLQAVKDILLKQQYNEIDEEDAENMIDDLEIPNLHQDDSSKKPQNTLHTPETESLENAYKYGYEKHDDQCSDGVYEGDVDLEPWMK